MKSKKLTVFVLATFLVAVFPRTLFTSERQPGFSQVIKKLREKVQLSDQKFIDEKVEVSCIDFDTEEFSFSLLAKERTEELGVIVRYRTKSTDDFFAVEFLDLHSNGVVSRGEVVGGAWKECCDLNDNPYLLEYGPQEEGFTRRWQDEYEKFLFCCLKVLDPNGILPILANSTPLGQ